MGAFLQVALPAIKAALGDRKAAFIIHTDRPKPIEQELTGYNLVIRPVPPGRGVHQCAGAANREALQLASPGSYVAFVNADMVPSLEIFEAAERRFDVGKGVIMMAATRTIGGLPPIGARARDLLEWTMRHRHPAVVECFWGRGRSSIPWAIYFENGRDIVLHGFHLHPFAVVKNHAGLTFQGISIDTDLMDQFKQDEVHVVTDADEAAFAEMSPPERVFRLEDNPFNVDDVVAWAQKNTTPLQRWMFESPICIMGNGGTSPFCEDIVQKLKLPPPPSHHQWRMRNERRQRGY